MSLYSLSLCTFHDPAFALIVLCTIPACDGRTDTSLSQRPRMHDVAGVKTKNCSRYRDTHIQPFSLAI